jgi:aspartate/glutamate racemase
VKHVVAVYTGHGLAEPLRREFAVQLPDVLLTSIVDDSLIRDARAAGRVTPAVARRLVQYFSIAREMGADVILNTCSSVGEVVPAARALFDVPIVRIDEPMVRQAVSSARRIGVLATIATTLGPTVRFLRAAADGRGGGVEIVEDLAPGAYEALVAGRGDEHDRLLVEAAFRLRDRSELIVLAQGSMARIADRLQEAVGLPVLSSLKSGIAEVKRLLDGIPA